MAEHDPNLSQVPKDSFPSAGARLRHARERLRLSRADIAARTKIAERHLAAIEEDRFSDLASSTYAVGFSRAYARAVGLDEREIALAVRGELDVTDEQDSASKPAFEPGDPARVPSSTTAWLAAGAAVAVLACLAIFWGSYYSPATSLPDLTDDTPPAAAAPAAPAAGSLPPAALQDAVVITAKEAGVWVKIVDADGKQLFQKLMAAGESYTVPADAAAPQLRVAWPDALAITVGGRPVPPLSDKRQVLTAPISATALLARGQGSAPAAAQQSPVPTPAAREPDARPTASPSAVAKPRVTSAPEAPRPIAVPSRPAAKTPAVIAAPPAPAVAAPRLRFRRLRRQPSPQRLSPRLPPFRNRSGSTARARRGKQLRYRGNSSSGVLSDHARWARWIREKVRG